MVDELVLSTGRAVRASLVDAANPAVFVKAEDIGLTGMELPRDTQANPAILERMEDIRTTAAVMMGLAKDKAQVSPAVPKVAFVAAPRDYTSSTGEVIRAVDFDLLARTKALAVMHKTYAVTGGICVSAAALIEGTVVSEVVGSRAKATGVVRIGHPSGVSQFIVGAERTPDGQWKLTKAGLGSTARRIMDGYVYVRRDLFDEQPGETVATGTALSSRG